MQKQKAKRANISRTGKVTDWEADVFAFPASFSATQPPGFRESRPSLTLSGVFEEPVKGVTAFELALKPGDLSTGKAEIPCVGVILQAKPVIAAHISLSTDEFHLVLALAIAGKPLVVEMYFQLPHYGSALISSCTIGTKKIEVSTDETRDA